MQRPKTLIDVCKDSTGKVVIAQSPNIPIIGWIVFAVISKVLSDGSIKTATARIASAFLFTWAYLEITSGVTWLRRAMGTAVIIVVILNYAK